MASSIQVLDADAFHIGDGDRIQTWRINWEKQQQWEVTQTDQGWELRSYKDQTYCLDAATQSLYSGGKVQLWTCNGKLQQRWLPVWAPEQDTYYLKSAAAPGRPATPWSAATPALCLDATLQHLGDGNTVQLWECNDQPQQAWLFAIAY